MKALVIFGSFAPQNNCAAIPNTKLVKYLEKEGVDITLIADAILPDMEIDESLLPENLNELERHEVRRSKLYLSTVASLRTKMTNSGVKLKMKAEKRKLRALLVSFVKHGYFTCSNIDWKISARKLVNQELSGQQYDIVYSSYPSVETHFLAGYIRQKGMAKKWIADFRDPMYYAEYDKYRASRKMRIQHQIEQKADHITVVSEGAKDKFSFDDIPESKITYIPNGYDPDDFSVKTAESTVKDSSLRIFYAGQLYAGKRDLSVIFQAFSELEKEGKIDRNRVSFEYAGNEWPIFEQFADQYGLADCCVNYGFVTRKKVMEIMAEIDCSVVASHNTATDQGVVTGKVFELLLVEKPIIAVVGGDLPNSELGRIIKECCAGVVYEQANSEQDYLKLKKWLADAYQQKRSKGCLPSSLNREAREQYNYRNIAHQLVGIMNSLCE